jgi:FlaG/FlaF family flagellin (archaellin)
MTGGTGTGGRKRANSSVVGSLLLIAVVAVSATVVGGTGVMRTMEPEPPTVPRSPKSSRR